MAEPTSPVEVFKRSTTAALRAIAERDDVTVSYGPEPPGVAGPRARLPLPPRDLSQQEACQVRGAADALALRLRYHDAQLHARRAPQGEMARAIFEGVEQARVEALGARRMSGVAANLSAMLEQRYRRQGYDRMTERSDSTLAEAIRLLTREQLTGTKPPP
ncbi:MAG TPA: cobaltochelatase subunit CobT, partial [Stellaceae bacterium]|nr:cobaltochelatase subunit CobT [Stellaceae bacterium]